MSRGALRSLPPAAIAATLAAAGAALTLIVATGPMDGTEVEHLALFLLPAIVLTAVLTALVAPALARAPVNLRFAGIAIFAALAGLANLAVLSLLMVVDEHDAGQIALLLIYSTAVGIGTALAAARASTEAVDRLSGAARRLAEGDLEARVGELRAGPELDALGRALDEMAERLGRSLARERAAESQRRDLITAVSHDLRTPIAGIRAMVEAIDDGVVEDGPTIRRYVREMRRSVDSLVVLIDDLFELVQLDAGAIESESERSRLTDVVRSALAAVDVQAAEKGLALETSFDGADTVLTSPRLTRVVQNLLQNAIRHTPADGTVRVEARRGADGVEVVVEDTGEGIEPAAVDHVFEPFWRGDAARRGDGAGLGLALAKRIVEALGGSIEVESEPARGSRFSVLLPDSR